MTSVSHKHCSISSWLNLAKIHLSCTFSIWPLRYAALRGVALHCTASHCTALHCTDASSHEKIDRRKDDFFGGLFFFTLAPFLFSRAMKGHKEGLIPPHLVWRCNIYSEKSSDFGFNAEKPFEESPSERSCGHPLFVTWMRNRKRP